VPQAPRETTAKKKKKKLKLKMKINEKMFRLLVRSGELEDYLQGKYRHTHTHTHTHTISARESLYI
jgi:hypothetical protein